MGRSWGASLNITEAVGAFGKTPPQGTRTTQSGLFEVARERGSFRSSGVVQLNTIAEHPDIPLRPLFNIRINMRSISDKAWRSRTRSKNNHQRLAS